jgi:type IV fimbrial biogenesis protein FimT
MNAATPRPASTSSGTARRAAPAGERRSCGSWSPGDGRGGDGARRRPSCAGFTLIELAVALAVFALLLAIIAPSAGAWMANMQIRATAESIQNGLQKARMEAVRRNLPVRFSLVSTNDPAVMDDSCALSSNSASWTVSVNDPAGKCGGALSDTADPMLVETYAAGVYARRVVVSATAADGATAAHSVTFDGFGRIVGATALAQVDLANAAAGNDFRPLRILISSGGSVRLCDPRVTATSDPRAC